MGRPLSAAGASPARPNARPFRWCLPSAARCDEFLQAGAQLCAVKTREGNYITIRLMLMVAVKQEEGSYPTERRGRISPHDRKN